MAARSKRPKAPSDGTETHKLDSEKLQAIKGPEPGHVSKEAHQLILLSGYVSINQSIDLLNRPDYVSFILIIYDV
jgi:hypothetical protein